MRSQRGFWNFILPAVASIAGALLTNKSREDVATDANVQSQANAREQMDFQERMRNTQYQAGVEDMQKAGLNPMLAYSQGGASSPSGAMGAVSMPQYENPIGGAIGSAMAYANLDKQRAEIENIDQHTKTLKSQEAEHYSGAVLKDWQQNQIQAYLNSKLPYEVGKLVSEIVQNNSSTQRIEQELRNLVTSQELTAAQAHAARLALYRAYAEAKVFQGMAPHIEKGVAGVNSAVDAAGSLDIPKWFRDTPYKSPWSSGRGGSSGSY